MCQGGRHSRVDVKILTLCLLFGFLRSPCVHFIHQKLNCVEKKNFLPPLNVDASFFCPPKFRRKIFASRACVDKTRASHFMLRILRFLGTDFISIQILWFGAHRGLFSALALVSIRSLFQEQFSKKRSKVSCLQTHMAEQKKAKIDKEYPLSMRVYIILHTLY